ncbi:hypothetical protein CCR75_008393 [Bremia lactucae]|uniref:Uncharacterized protein n=1 Tax=Bremia lactucae TaxID=4779 RepID=A0A976ICK8_BRELC|nr:hypothetical protein CCR75_008393 [Bremia lactucae]
MGHKTKSQCQIRLEARSRACCAPRSFATTRQLQAAELQSRIARANAIRAMYTRQLATRARARVQHAQDVARGMRAKRHEDSRRFRQSSVSKLDQAARRRHEQLAQLQLQCQQRAHLIVAKVELVRASQDNKAARARRTLAGQLAAAAYRRQTTQQQLLRRLNARWQSVEHVKARVAKVKFIQRWYRRHVANRTIATALQAVHMDVNDVVTCWRRMKHASFEACMKLVQQRSVVEAAQKLVHVLHVEATSGHCHASTWCRMRVRVLMMAGLIAWHPRAIMGPEWPSQRLAYAGKAMVQEMETLALCLSASQRLQELSKCVARFSARFVFYSEAFARWKARDAQRLTTELLQSYRELMRVSNKYERQAEETPSGGDGVHELRRQTQRQLGQVKEALERLGGRKKTMQQLEELTRTMADEAAKGHVADCDSSHVEVDSSHVEADSSHVKADSSHVEADSSPLEVASSLLEADSSPFDTDSSHGDTGSTLCPSRHEATQEMEANGTDGSTVETNTREALDLNEVLLSDAALVHELIFNPQYQTVRDKDIETSAAMMTSTQSVATLAVRVREAMTRAFWDRVVAMNDVATLLARTEELRLSFRKALGGGYGSTLGARSRLLANEVDSALEASRLAEMMQDPLRHASLLEARCTTVLDVIERAEAPARLERTRHFRSEWVHQIASNKLPPIELLVTFLAFAFDKVDELQTDVLNAHYNFLGQYLQRHGVDWEQKMMQAQLSKNRGNLESAFPFTNKWLNMEGRAYCLRDDIAKTEVDLLRQADGKALKRLLRACIWTLVIKHIDGTAERVWPETFALDIARIRACRDTIDRIAIVSSLVAVVQDVGAFPGFKMSKFLNLLGQKLNVLLCSNGVSKAQVVAQVVTDLQQFRNEKLTKEGQHLEKRLLGSFAVDDVVRQLFFSRVARAIESALLPVFEKRADLHFSLAPFATDIYDASVELRRLVEHNERVYATVYNVMMKQVVDSALADYKS